MDQLFNKIKSGDRKALAQCISMIENDEQGSFELLKNLRFEKKIPVIGFTGPPGAGKSTLVSAMLEKADNKKVGVIAVDPSSPFTKGALLGDRIRMGRHFTNENIFIRSVSTRGMLGGLSARVPEIADVLKASGFDYVFIETVGVGQSELEIASLADTTVVVLAPESGDEIQSIKSGIMEIADVFAVNKSDREGADLFVKNLHTMLHLRPASEWKIPVIKTVATQGAGIPDLWKQIIAHGSHPDESKQKALALQKIVRLISSQALKKINLPELELKLNSSFSDSAFNIYRFSERYF